MDETFLFPPSIRDFVPSDHVSHFIRELVRTELDLSEIYAGYRQGGSGNLPYDPAMMSAILLYSYTQGVYSSRKIARHCSERVDFMAVSGMQRPDFRTIALFRKRHLESLGGLFVQVVKLCEAAGLLKLGHVATDGSKMKANASKKKNKSYKRLKEEEQALEADIASWFEQAEAIDAAEDELYGEDKTGHELPAWVADKEERRKRIAAAKKSLEAKDKAEREARKKAEKAGTKPRSREKKREAPKETRKENLSDSDSSLMKGSGSDGFIQGYNTQLSVDTDSYVAVSGYVTNRKNDKEELEPNIKAIKKTTGRIPAELSADAGYCSEQNLELLVQHGIRGYVALGKKPNESARPITPGTRTHQMQQRLKKAGKRSRYRLRGQTVEPVFGVIKATMGFRQFLLRGLENVNNEWLLVLTAYNLKKLARAKA